MGDKIFDYEIKVVEQHLETLWQYANEWAAPQREFLGQVLEHLSNTLEELRVARGGLQEQNEKLITTQQTLEAERQRYQELFEFAPDGYLVTDASGFIQEANRAAANLFSITQDFLLGKPLAIFVAEEDRRIFENQLTQLRKLEQVRDWELHLKPRRGAPFHVAVAVAAVRGSQGKLIGLRWSIRDVTERKRAEKALREGERRYRDLFENVPTGIYRTTPDGRIIMANPALIRMLGYSSFDELASHNLEKEGGYQPIHYRRQFKELLEREDEVRGLEFSWTRCDGTPIFIRESARAVRGENGAVLCYEGTVEDITERKRAEEERTQLLAQQQQFTSRLQKLAEASLTINSALSLDEMLRLITEQAREIIGAHQSVTSMTVDENWAQAINAVSLSDKYAAWREYNEKPDGSGIYSLVCRMNRSMRMTQAELEAHPAWRGFGKEAGKHPPMRSWLAVPLVGRDGQNLGLIQLSDKYEDEFTEEDESILVQLAQMASVAIENTRLYYKAQEEVAERKRAEEAIRENLAHLSKKNRYEIIVSTVTRSVHQSINLQDVLENAVDSMNKNMEGVDNVSIYMVEREEAGSTSSPQAVLKAHRGYPDWWIRRVRSIPYPMGFTWKTIIEGKPLYCADVDLDTVIGPAGREMGTKSYASMPIHFGGKTVGSININSLQKNAFDEEELRLLEIVAHQIEMAINNAQQAELLHQANEELEMRVRERTRELSETNEELKKEIAWRKQVEKALRNSEEQYRTLYENNPSMYFTIDKKGNILSVNQFGAEQLGYTAQELIGQPVLSIFHEDDKRTVSEHLVTCLQSPTQVAHWEFRKVRKDGSVLWVRESARAVRRSDGSAVVLIVCEDITERKRTEEQIKASLKEKEVLLKEIHHRVKNNLQVISSLLDLQTEHLKDKQAIEVLNKSRSRVRSMALVHGRLYQSKNMAKVDFAEYIRELTDNLFYSYGINSDKIKLKINADDVLLSINSAVPCGLIINELVSNSLKYAFPRNKKGEIRISLHSDNRSDPSRSQFTLIVSNNGVSFPKNLDFRKTESLGFQLVVALVEQIEGAIELDRTDGVEFKITFTEPKPKEEIGALIE